MTNTNESKWREFYVRPWINILKGFYEARLKRELLIGEHDIHVVEIAALNELRTQLAAANAKIKELKFELDNQMKSTGYKMLESELAAANAEIDGLKESLKKMIYLEEGAVEVIARHNSKATREITKLTEENEQLKEALGAEESIIWSRYHEIKVENKKLTEENARLKDDNNKLESDK